MRVLNQNRQALHYATYNENIIIYATDEDGNILKTKVDDVEVPVIEAETSGYNDAVEFNANISLNSGDTALAEYGLNVGDYNAVISANKGELPFDERTLIWHTSEPQHDDYGNICPESADYRVIAIKTSLNEERFILKRRVDDE